MAIITRFERESQKQPKQQPTQVACRWSVLRADGPATLLQLDTFGSNARAKPGKQSQTLQLDRDRAAELCAILKREFDL